MALASTSISDLSRCSYHVFLSFSGEETRKNFTDHLYTAFVNAGLSTFKDDEELEIGEDISRGLTKAITQSRSSVIVFSKDYASSWWCLDELVMILERKRTCGQLVLPIFYDIQPSEVRKQSTKRFRKAFAEHEKNESRRHKVVGWKAALAEAADLKGMVLQNQDDGHEARFIQKIVKVIRDKLNRLPFLCVAERVIGIDSQVEKINARIQEESDAVGIVAICGMRGIGKTTMAKVVYNSNSKRFEGSSFIENVKETSAVKVQKQFLSDVFNRREEEIRSVSEGMSKIRDVIGSKKILLVLDDVDHADHLEMVVRMRDQFHPGSKVIVTSTNFGLLKAQHQVVIQVHYVVPFGNSESLELFSWHAFGQDHPIGGYMELAQRVVDHCAGLPLALEVLGRSVSGQSISVWESTLDKLEEIPNDEILNKLRVSYYSLQDDHDRELFLHIACFFQGRNAQEVYKILNGCDFHSVIGVQNLVDRCLVRVYDYWIYMHDMIRDMGRGIVRRESEEPGERSRLWNPRDCFNVLTEHTGSKKIKGLALDMERHPEYDDSDQQVVETSAFSRMVNIKLLQLNHVRLDDGGYDKFPRGLRWLRWQQYPLESFPSDFPLRSMVVLEICHGSSLRRLWNEPHERFPKMKVLNLSHSHGLTETPNFSAVPNLERLILKDCTNLVHVHESIENLQRLVYVDLEDCRSIWIRTVLDELPTSIETLIISGCSNLNELPTGMRKLESLKVLRADRGVPGPTNVPKNCWVSFLPRNLVDLSLQDWNLSDDDFPVNFGSLSSLRCLDLSGNLISGLPTGIRDLTNLCYLVLSYCPMLKSLVRLPRIREKLVVNASGSLERVTFQSSVSHPPTVDRLYCFELIDLDYSFKLQPIERVDEEMINILGLTSLLDSIKTKQIDLERDLERSLRKRNRYPIQGLYEHGIFSTYLPDLGVPDWFNHKAQGSSVSLTVPSLPNIMIRGFNFFAVYGWHQGQVPLAYRSRSSLVVIVSNESRGLKWIYLPEFVGLPPLCPNDVSVTWLSHWKTGNEFIRGGNEMLLSVLSSADLEIRWCGIEVVYEQQEKMTTAHRNTADEEDPTNYLRGVTDFAFSEYQRNPGTCILSQHSGAFNKFIFDSVFNLQNSRPFKLPGYSLLTEIMIHLLRRSGRGKEESIDILDIIGTNNDPSTSSPILLTSLQLR